jgi:hypothetical protein
LGVFIYPIYLLIGIILCWIVLLFYVCCEDENLLNAVSTFL